MKIPKLTYKDIKEGKIFLKEFTAILFYNSSTAGAYLLELSLKDILYELGETISIFKINDFENEELAKDYKLFSESSILCYYKNSLVEIIYGPIPKEKLKEKIKHLIRNYKEKKML